MATDRIEATFRCKACGEQLTWDDDIDDETIVTCQACGTQIATLGEIRQAALDKASAQIADFMKGFGKGR